MRPVSLFLDHLLLQTPYTYSNSRPPIALIHTHTLSHSHKLIPAFTTLRNYHTLHPSLIYPLWTHTTLPILYYYITMHCNLLCLSNHSYYTIHFSFVRRTIPHLLTPTSGSYMTILERNVIAVHET